MRYIIKESQLQNMVKEALNELDWKTYASARKKRDDWVKEHPVHGANKWNRFHDFERAAVDAFNKKYDLENQYDNGAWGGEEGTINLNNSDGKFELTGSRNHDFGDGDEHGLGHTVYHMGKRYGNGGDYGRTRMWDWSHPTTPEEFYGDEEKGKKFRAAEKDVEDFENGKSKYVKGKGWQSNESKTPKRTIKESQLREIIKNVIQEGWGNFNFEAPRDWFDDLNGTDNTNNFNVSQSDIKMLQGLANKLTTFGNNKDGNTQLLFNASNLIMEYLSDFYPAFRQGAA